MVVKTTAGKLAPGIDVRGEKGIILAAPSSKSNGTRYEWINSPDDCELADCPDLLLDKIAEAQGGKRTSKAVPLGNFPPADPIFDWLKDAGYLSGNQSEGWWEIICPWADKHSDNDTRAYYLPRGGPNARRGFNCFHSHKHGIHEFLAWVAQQGGPCVEAEDQMIWQRPVLAGGELKTGDKKPIELNQDALAIQMGKKGWDADARYVAAWNRWLFWDGVRWRVDDLLAHLTKAREFMRSLAADIMKDAQDRCAGLAEGAANKVLAKAKREADKLREKAMIAAVEQLARSNPASVAHPDVFDADPLLLGTPSGTVDLRTGVLREAKRGDLITKLTAASPAPTGSSPILWLKFLNEIFKGDQDVISFMQRAAGYSPTGEVSEHKLLFLYGGGRNGKSVFVNTLFDIFGDYSRRAASATFLNSQQERHPTDIAGLQGARLVVGSELPVGKTWDEAVIKNLTGGDVMTARFMRGDFFDFSPQLTLMIAGNNQPSFRGVDEAIRARVVLVPFNWTIPEAERDVSLPAKLKAEAPEILRWAIDGAVQWQAEGLNVPAVIAEASAEYFDAEDTVGRFLKDETQKAPGQFVSSQELHSRFKLWCSLQGLTAFTQMTLMKDIRGRGFEKAKSGGKRGLSGLKLRPQSEVQRMQQELHDAAE